MTPRENAARAASGQNPVTPAEWQLCVEGAEALLQLDACRQYGLIKGGPKVNVERCRWILAEGKRQGIAPSPDSFAQLVAAIGVTHA